MSFTYLAKSAAIVWAIAHGAAAFAYTPEMKKEICKKPKYREFSLPEYKAPDYREVPPESEFTFTLSAWADIDTLKVAVKKTPLPFTFQTTSTYHRVRVKLPADLNGQYVRINVTVKAELGCDEQAGWLIKIADAAPAASQPKAGETDAGGAAAETPSAGDSGAAAPPGSAPPAAQQRTQ